MNPRKYFTLRAQDKDVPTFWLLLYVLQDDLLETLARLGLCLARCRWPPDIGVRFDGFTESSLRDWKQCLGAFSSIVRIRTIKGYYTKYSDPYMALH